MGHTAQARHLEVPDNLGSPMQPYWSPSARRYFDRNWRYARIGESGWFVLRSLLIGAIALVGLAVLGNIVNALVSSL